MRPPLWMSIEPIGPEVRILLTEPSEGTALKARLPCPPASERAVPALLEALQLTTKAARVGFDWKKAEDVLLKLEEEIRELREEIAHEGVSNEAVAGEIGDILFVVANLARWSGVEPESALKATNHKFRRRFRHVEKRIAEQGRAWQEVSLEEMDEHWDEAKRIERGGKGN